MPEHTRTERAKQPKKVKKEKKVKKVNKVKKAANTPKRSMTMAERMGWTTNTQEIVLKGDLRPTVDPIADVCWLWES